MAEISDNSRGIEAKGLPPVLLSLPTKPVDRQQVVRDAAVTLGKIFLALRPEDRSLGRWALPGLRNVMEEPVLSFQIDLATAKVFGQDVEVRRRFQRYFNCYDTVIAPIRDAAAAWAQTTLRGQAATLGGLQRELADPEFAKWMHEASIQIERRSGPCGESQRRRVASDILSAYAGALPAGPDSHLPDWGLAKSLDRCLVSAAQAFIEADKLADPPFAYDYVPKIPTALKNRYVQLLTILLFHPRRQDIVSAYERSAVQGIQVAQQVVRGAAVATSDFAQSLAQTPNHVWRYQLLLLAGVKELGLDDIPGFQEFTVAIGRLLGESGLEKLVNYLGAGLFVVGLFSPVGAGMLVIGVFDLALGGAGAYLAYVREHEQEFAAKASLFLPDTQQFASSYGYGDTALAAAFSLVSAVSLIRPVASAVKSLPNAKVDLKTVTVPDSIGATTTKTPPSQNVAPEVKVIGSESNTIAPESKAVTPESNAVAPESNAVAPQTKAVENTATKPQVTETAGAPKPSERLTSVEPPAGANNPVPDVPLREPRRAKLEAELQEVKERIQANTAFNSQIDKQIRPLLQQQRAAKAHGLTDTYNELEGQIKDLSNQKFRSTPDRVTPTGEVIGTTPDSQRYHEILRLLRGTEKQYYDALTGAATRTPAFQAVQSGGVDKMFKPFQGTPWVEHLYPRIKIWGKPGFEKLKWAQQTFLFAWRRNLKLMSATLNNRRGTTPYRNVRRDVWGDFIKTEEDVAELSRLEIKAEADIEAMIKNPRIIDAMMQNPRLEALFVERPLLMQTLLENPGLIETVAKNPDAIDSIIKNLSLATTP